MSRIHDFATAIDRGDRETAATLVEAMTPADVFITDQLCQGRVLHWFYAGNTALHVLAAAHQAEGMARLVAAGFGVDAAPGRRHATPLHHAADGAIGHPSYDPDAQVAAIRELLRLGADPLAVDANGNTPIMRAIRCRAAAAVEALIHADGARFTPAQQQKVRRLLAFNTGRGGSGSPDAHANRDRIAQLLAAAAT